MPYTVYYQYEYRVTVDADSYEEAIEKANDVPIDATSDMLVYLDTLEIEKWDWNNTEPSKWKRYENGEEVE